MTPPLSQQVQKLGPDYTLRFVHADWPARCWDGGVDNKGQVSR